MSTVLTAYVILEDRGFVEVRPKSGYYIRRSPVKGHKAPSINQTTSAPQRIMEVMRDSGSPDFISFAAAVPDNDFSVVYQLKRIFAKVTRNATFLDIGYDSPKGSKPLRRQLARCAMDAGIWVSSDEIITTFGCQNSIGLCLLALTKAGDIVAVETP